MSKLLISGAPCLWQKHISHKVHKTPFSGLFGRLAAQNTQKTEKAGSREASPAEQNF